MHNVSSVKILPASQCFDKHPAFSTNHSADINYNGEPWPELPQ